MDLTSETKNANMVKDILLQKLLEDEVITEDQHNIYSKNWHIIIVKKNWFQKLTDKDNKDVWYFKLVNMVWNGGYEPKNSLTL